ncbi:MAG: lipopolysaccharide heptosyltransferase II [Thermodesulfobacteria bacterium]|nr:lipopolysaccharide heptosyltransferase II [Thermodesulfobacteriota bacterium]
MSRKFPKEGVLLLRLPNWVGDAVMASPVVANLLATYEGLALVGRPHILGLFQGLPALEGLFPLSPGRGALLSLARKIRGRFKCGLLLPNSFSSALLFFLARVKARAGYATDGRRFLLTHPVKRPTKPLHQRDYYLELLKGLGIETPFKKLRLFLPEEATKRAESFLTELPPPRAVLAPGAAFGPAKCWPLSRYRALAYHLRRKGFSVLVVGSAAEHRAGAEITKDLARARNLCGLLDLATTAAVITRADLFVSNDSGLMHVAAAAGVPQVAIFGSTSPEATGPLNPRARVLKADVPCSPCFARTCKRGYFCFEKIQVAEVLEACLQVLT